MTSVRDKGGNMDKLINILLRYHKDIDAMDINTLEEVCEVLDAFLADLKISGWDGKVIGYP